MPLILLAEDEAPTVDHVRSVLASQGWLVKTVDSRDQALRAASEFAPQLVLVNDRLAGVEDLVRTFSRRSGGPGVVLLSSEANGAGSLPHDADDVEAVLNKPLETEKLISTVRNRLAEGQEQKASTPVAPAKKILTSKEIFGDLLDDILDPDQDVTQPEPSATASSSEPEATSTEIPEPIALVEPPAEVDSAPVEELVADDSEDETAQPIAVVEESAEDVAAEIPVDVSPAEAAEAIPENEMADLEDMVREEVGAWAETVDEPEDEEPIVAEAIEVEAETVSEPDDTAEPEAVEDIRPAAMGIKPVLDPFDDVSEPATVDEAQPSVEEEIELVDDLTESVIEETEAASKAAEPEPTADVGSLLEDTLAGVFVDSLTEVNTASKSSRLDDDVSVDALLSSALGDLNLGGTTTRKSEPEPEIELVEKDEPESVASSAVEPPSEEASSVDSDASEEAPEPEPSESTTKSKSKQVPAGEEFGDYTLEKRIGLGGMAEVWKARRKGVEGFQKRVAIKKILPQAAENEAFVEMFIDEAKLAAQLNHNNIIHIYDLGRLGEDYYIAMEYVDGKNLRQILNSGSKTGQPIPEGIALYIASRLASALDYAHHSKDFNDADLGLVHRDVSPQNVLISTDGDIKLCDFGIAKAVSKISTTQMGALKGKLQYMSPEQAWGKSIDHRSDIFSLGTLMYEMLTGKRLFAGESEMSVLEDVRECDVGSRIIQSESIAAEVKGLLLRALAREPEGRFESASELQAGLEEVLAEQATTPGQKELAAYMQTLLDESIEPETEGSEALQVRDEDLGEAEWIGDLKDLDEPAQTEDDERKQAFLKKLLTKLLPVILVLAGLGGILGYALTRDEGPSAEPTSSDARAPTTESVVSTPADPPPLPQTTQNQVPANSSAQSHA